jgi:hypothetical protein
MKGQDAERLAEVLAQCPGLAHLDLSHNYNFGADGAEMLAGVLGQCRELVHLDLRCNNLDLSCNNLDLGENHISDAGADNLARTLMPYTAVPEGPVH